MAIDYKYSKYGSQEHRVRFSSLFLRIVILVLVITVLIYAAFFIFVRKTDAHILSGRYEQATRTLHKWKWLPLVSGRVYEKIGTAELLSKGASAATPHFRQASQKIFFAPVSFWQEVLKTLWSTGRYDDGILYATHIQPKLPRANIIHFFKAGFLTGANQLHEASKELQLSGNLPEFTRESALLRSEIEQRLATGKFTFIYDRENLPLVNMNLKGDAAFVYEPVRALLQNGSGDYLAVLKRKPQNQVALALDYRIQNEAIKALGKYAGAIVLMNPKTGEILAAASSTKGVGSEYSPNTSIALDTLYEPGSIIKIITLAGALEKGMDVSKMFPLNCEGRLPLTEQKILYDWMVHQQVKDINVATAVSCNVSFAKLGMAMKPADLLANLRQFGFDTKLQEAFLPLRTGEIKPASFTDEYIAKLSIGLDYLQMTPLHAALLAGAIANGGNCMMPRLLLQYRNVIGLPYAPQQPVLYKRFMSANTASVLTRAMQDVVLHSEGTGRRASIPNFAMALKTGTAGEGSKGYNAVIIGFGPVPNPKIAFAIVIEHAGKAEWEGARVTKLFLESIQGYIK